MQAFAVVSLSVDAVAVRGIITLALQVWIVLLMVKKRVAVRVPIFFAYIVYQIAEGLFRWVIESTWGIGSSRYYHAYWNTEILEILLLFLALGESVWHVFRWFRKLQCFWPAMTTCLVVTLGYSVWSGWHDPPKGVSRQMSMIIQADLIATFVPIGVGVFYFWLIFRFRIGQYPREAAIVAGLAITSGAAVIMMGLRSYFGPKSFVATAWIAPLGYMFAESGWIREFLRPDLPEEVVDKARVRAVLEKANEALGGYEERLKEINRPKK